MAFMDEVASDEVLHLAYQWALQAKEELSAQRIRGGRALGRIRAPCATFTPSFWRVRTSCQTQSADSECQRSGTCLLQ